MINSWFEVFIFLAVGIFLASNNYWLATALLLLILTLLVLYCKSDSQRAITGIIIVAAGILYFMAAENPPTSDLKARDSVVVTGTVANIPACDGPKTRFIIVSDSPEENEKKLQVSCYFKSDLQKGDKVELRGALKVPVPPGNPGEFDYPRYLSYQHIYYLFIVKDDTDLKILAPPGFPQNWLNSFSQHYAQLVNDVLPPQEAAILQGMLLGKVDGIEPEQYKDFQKTGIIHVFSVSGLHVGFLLLLAAWVTSLFNLSPRYKFWSCLILIFAYGSLVSWPVPVQRSVLMAGLGLFAHYMGREQQLLNSLGLAGCLILVLDPRALFMISFQLTFLATWGLLYLYPLLKKRLQYKNILVDLILISLCAQVAVVPLIAYYFNLFSPLSLLSNLLTTYLSAGVVILGFIALMLAGLWSGLATLFLYPVGLFIELILGLNNFVIQLPAAFVWVATPPLILVVAYYCGLLLLIKYWSSEGNRVYSYGGLVLISIFFIFIGLPAQVYDRGNMEAVFIDVGQGDSILLKSPQGKFILVDGGGSQFFDPGSDKVLPYLHRRGIRELYMIINSHPDLDHLQGLEKVAGEMPVQYIAIPACLAEAQEYDLLKNLVRKRNAVLLKLAEGQEINLEKDWMIKVLYPERKAVGEDYNNRSLVLRVAYKDFSLLLTGDLEKEGLNTILQTHQLQPSTVVKVPHHGSKGSLSPEFYAVTKPYLAVISVGANNNFGHPHPDVLQTLTEQGTKVYRTDKDGAIRVKSDGTSMEVQPTRGVCQPAGHWD
ncbi:MAG: DNA internalization-related competence protein ComEC/Rec2 [Syntrophomonas sp.]